MSRPSDRAIAEAFREAERRELSACTWGQARNAINIRARELDASGVDDRGGNPEYVLALLIAAGYVTQGKVDEARMIALDLAPGPLTRPPVESAQRADWPAGVLDRIEAAMRRIEDGHAPRRIPADPTDVDLVLAEVRDYITGKAPPFWLAAAPAAGGGEGDHD